MASIQFSALFNGEPSVDPKCQAQGPFAFAHLVLKAAVTAYLYRTVKNFLEEHSGLQSQIKKYFWAILYPLYLTTFFELVNAILQVVPIGGGEELLRGISEAITILVDFQCLYSVFAFVLFVFKFRKQAEHWYRCHQNFPEYILKRQEDIWVKELKKQFRKLIYLISFISIQGILQTIDLRLYIDMPPWAEYVTMSVVILFSLVTSFTILAMATLVIFYFMEMDYVVYRLQKIQFPEPNPYSQEIFKSKMKKVSVFLPMTFLMMLLGTVFQLLTKNVSDSFCYSSAVFYGLGKLGLYVTPVPMVWFMCFSVQFVVEFLKECNIKNTDNTMEYCARIFNRRRKEERERGAEAAAMQAQDYVELLNQMERNEILMLIHQYRDECLDCVFLTYYQNRKYMDIWPENRKPDDPAEVAADRKKKAREKKEQELKDEGLRSTDIQTALEEYDEQVMREENESNQTAEDNSKSGNFGESNLSSNLSSNEQQKPAYDSPFSIDYLRDPNRFSQGNESKPAFELPKKKIRGKKEYQRDWQMRLYNMNHEGEPQYNKLVEKAVPRSIDAAHWFLQHEFFYFTISHFVDEKNSERKHQSTISLNLD